MKKRILIGGLCFLVLAVLAFGTLPTGRAQDDGPQLYDMPLPPYNTLMQDCQLHAYEREQTCLNKFYDKFNAYNTAGILGEANPQSCAFKECNHDCVNWILGILMTPPSAQCTQCISDCTLGRYQEQYAAEMALGTPACGNSAAQLDTCTSARIGLQMCALNYEVCGGFEVAGCSDAFMACRLATGIDLCQ